MTKIVTQYEIYLPLQYNDGTWIEDEKYNHVHQRLFDRFGGVTHIMQAIGDKVSSYPKSYFEKVMKGKEVQT